MNFQNTRDKENPQIFQIEKNTPCTKSAIRIAPSFSTATLTAGRQKSNGFKIQKQKDFQPRVMYVVKLQIKCDGRMKAFFQKYEASKNVCSQVIFLRKLLRCALWKWGDKPPVGKYEIPVKGDSTQQTGKGNSHITAGNRPLENLIQLKEEDPKRMPEGITPRENKPVDWHAWLYYGHFYISAGSF